LPDSVRVRPGVSTEVILFASHGVEVQALALVPLADELGPPRPGP
jgi:hypothetical protein